MKISQIYRPFYFAVLVVWSVVATSFSTQAVAAESISAASSVPSSSGYSNAYKIEYFIGSMVTGVMRMRFVDEKENNVLMAGALGNIFCVSPAGGSFLYSNLSLADFRAQAHHARGAGLAMAIFGFYDSSNKQIGFINHGGGIGAVELGLFKWFTE